jgi:hypothetical protein
LVVVEQFPSEYRSVATVGSALVQSVTPGPYWLEKTHSLGRVEFAGLALVAVAEAWLVLAAPPQPASARAATAATATVLAANG